MRQLIYHADYKLIYNKFAGKFKDMDKLGIEKITASEINLTKQNGSINKYDYLQNVIRIKFGPNR